MRRMSSCLRSTGAGWRLAWPLHRLMTHAHQTPAVPGMSSSMAAGPRDPLTLGWLHRRRNALSELHRTPSELHNLRSPTQLRSMQPHVQPARSHHQGRAGHPMRGPQLQVPQGQRTFQHWGPATPLSTTGLLDVTAAVRPQATAVKLQHPSSTMPAIWRHTAQRTALCINSSAHSAVGLISCQRNSQSCKDWNSTLSGSVSETLSWSKVMSDGRQGITGRLRTVFCC